MKKYLLIINLILVSLIVVFSIQNAAAVKVVFWIWKVEISLALLMVVCVGTGILIASVANLFTGDKKKSIRKNKPGDDIPGSANDKTKNKSDDNVS